MLCFKRKKHIVFGIMINNDNLKKYRKDNKFTVKIIFYTFKSLGIISERFKKGKSFYFEVLYRNI